MGLLIICEGDCEENVLKTVFERLRKGKESRTRIKVASANGKPNIVRTQAGFEETVRRHHALGYRSFLVLIDGDDVFKPYNDLTSEIADMRSRSDKISQELGVPVNTFWAVKNLESWLIGGYGSKTTILGNPLRRGVPANTENERNGKDWIKRQLRNRDYDTADQRRIAVEIDINDACQRNASLRTFLDSVPN